MSQIRRILGRCLRPLAVGLFCAHQLGAAGVVVKKKPVPARAAVAKAAPRVTPKSTARRPAPVANLAAPRRKVATKTSPNSKKLTGPWRVPNYADSSTGDQFEGDDMMAREAALRALGRLNGTVVVAEAGTGRVLTIVNQKLAYRDGYQPCSTVKVPVALAALSESLVDRFTLIRLYGRVKLAMTEALAKSNNQYFASLGEKLGFDRMTYYARLFGLGEKAGWEIEGEHAGVLPPATPKSGMGMMTSFGDGIALTPLELTALIGAVANGGTLYYLQYPQSGQDADIMIPRIKRKLDINEIIPEIKPGMAGAVEYGTARRIGYDPDLPIFGKTGTCTDSRTPTHLGWFGSFSEIGKEKLVVTVLLTGGSAVSGPAAAGVAGQVYKNLNNSNFFARQGRGKHDVIVARK